MKLKIDEKSTKLCALAELSAGDVFMLKTEAFIVTNVESGQNQTLVVNLENGKEQSLDNNVEVTVPVNVTLYIKR